MPDPQYEMDPEFDAQLRGLFQEAEQVLESRAAASRRMDSKPPYTPPQPRPEVIEIDLPGSASPAPERSGGTTVSSELSAQLSQMLRPLLVGFDSLVRAVGDNNTVLGRLDSRSNASAQLEADLAKIMGELRSALENKNGVNQRMFDALHQELRGYKDGFLLESICRPVIRDLIDLYDEQVELHRQVSAILGDHAAESGSALFSRVQTLETNMGHNVEFILEMLARMEVVPMPPGGGRLDKRTQRTVAVEWTDNPAEDGLIVRTVKRGFVWKEKMFRAEEVVARKCQGNVTAAEEKGSTADF